MNEKTPTFLTYQQTSKLLEIPLATLYSKTCRKEIPHIRLGPRSVRFEYSEIMTWIKERRVAVN